MEEDTKRVMERAMFNALLLMYEDNSIHELSLFSDDPLPDGYGLEATNFEG